jgi:hypothetical protein
MNRKGYYVNVYANKNKKESKYLKIWEYEEALIFKCACGGKSVCFQFTGSPLSGSQGDACTICLECSKVDMKGGKSTRLWDKLQARKKHAPIEPIAENCATYEELITACQTL